VSDKEMIEYRSDPMFRNTPALNVQLQWLTIQASYWLGSALFEIDSIGAAKDSLMEIRTSPLNMWRHQTEYLLGRIAERERRYEGARRHYSNTASSLSGAGNALRARRLP
jgi:TolA-binding protein